jgi:hypothetical protein
MTIARAHLVDPAVTRWYHCITHCVRRAFLLGEGDFDRKAWIDHRLKELAETFAVAVGGYAVLDNHLHVLVRLDSDVAKGWSDNDVVQRWSRLCPPRDSMRRALPINDAWVQTQLADAPWVNRARQRLQSLSWFMKCLKEPISRLANRQEQTRGAFFEGRFKSVAILDEESLLATCAYIALTGTAAGSIRPCPRMDRLQGKQSDRPGRPYLRRGEIVSICVIEDEPRVDCRFVTSHSNA